ncbi:MAG: trehalose-6-phosphate synthase [Acidimicrobiia bacterium]
MMIVTHRGPFSFSVRDDGGFEAKRGAGGLVSALLPLVDAGIGDGRERVAWIAATIDDDDRAALEAGGATVPGLDLHLLALDPAQHRLHYDIVSNATLWFLHHGLFDLPRRPRFDEHFRTAWQGYIDVNQTFANAVIEAAAHGERVLVHDYQLALVPGMVRAARPDLSMVHFTHTPFCGPNSIRVLPTDIAVVLCRSMASVPAGFHTARWAQAYEASARTVLGIEAPIRRPFATPLGPDPDALAEDSAAAFASGRVQEVDEFVGDRKLILRSDRIDPAKNIVRGFHAYDQMLASHEEWRERVVFVARLTPSRENLAEYLAYRQEVEQAAARVNNRWARGDWQPVVVDTLDDYERSVAAFTRYDVLLVNPLKDGLNLVAKEGPLVNQRDGVLCLSPEAGSFDELRDAVVPVHPYDISQQAGALHTALTMPVGERAHRARRLRALVALHTPRSWLDELLRHSA